MWFYLDAWGEKWTIGKSGTDQHGGYHRLARDGKVKIDSNEYASGPVQLTGQESIQVRSVGEPLNPRIMEFGQLTEWSRGTMDRLQLHG